MDDGYYLLENRRVIRCRSRMEWIERRTALPEDWNVVAETTVGGTRVSTVFLMGINHAYDDGPPVLFETLTFGEGVLEEFQLRYTTVEEAERGHAQVVHVLEEAERELDKLYAKVQ